MTVPIVFSDVDCAIDKYLPWAEALFDDIGRKTTVDGAICRAPFGTGEQLALDTVAAAAGDLGLWVTTDLIGNVHMRWRVSDKPASQCLVGSHLDSVPNGGNFDGLAGVIAGLTATAALREAGMRPYHDITTIGIRAEENAWFACQHIGSRIGLGIFDRVLLDRARRIDTGSTLAHHIALAGIDLEPIRDGVRSIDPGTIQCFIEVHIEQGYTLEERDLPLGIVFAVRGNLRCQRCRCIGAYDHAGVVPRRSRKDAMVAVAEVIMEMDRNWVDRDAAGQDLVMTFGQAGTNPASHSVTVIPGEATFSFDARSHSLEILNSVEEELLTTAKSIELRRGVSFHFENITRSNPVSMDRQLGQRMLATAEALRIPAIEMVSGAGHDVVDFEEAGIRSGLIFVRSSNGSHNPFESMAMADFAQGAGLLAMTLAEEAKG